ncbi:MAG: DUF418 domain-containing protein [Ferruginibacter sp.]|nr:DUF418 domain-containing protein [Ferruginibacter sp.]
MEFVASHPADNESIIPIENTEVVSSSAKISNGHSPHPVETADRIHTVDMVRGVALLGILLMNIPVFGIDWSVANSVLRGPSTTTDFRTMAVIFTFFDGTMRGLFSMLFGAGMVLFTLNKKQVPGGVSVAEYYYRRLLWLVAFGMFNAYILLWEGDILFYYGLFGMLLYPFRKLAASWLIIIGILCITIGMFKNVWWFQQTRETRANYLSAVAAEKEKKKLTTKQEEAKTAWDNIIKSQAPDTVKINKNIQTMRSDYGSIFKHFIPRNSGNETWGTYHGIWDMLSMMFIGMGLFIMGFFSNKLSTSTYGMCLLVGYGLGIPIGYIFFKGAVIDSQDIARYVDAYSIPHWVLYDGRRLLLCLGHASLIMLIYRSKVVPWLMKALANVGQMAFTNYLMQSIICTLFFFGYGFGNYNKLSVHQLYYVVGTVWIFQLIFSSIWLKYFRFGPFEWAWRSLTYWIKQPFVKRENKISES